MDIKNIIIGIVLALAALAILYLFFLRKPAQPQLEEPVKPQKLPGKPKEPATERPADKKPAPEKKPAEKPAIPAEKPAAEKPAPPVAEEPAEEPAEKPATTASPVAETPGPETPAVKTAPERPAPAKPTPKPAAAREAARKHDVEGLRKGLSKVREKEGFFGRLKALFTATKEIDPNIVGQMEEVLLTSDVGVKTTELLLGEIREALDRKELADADRVWDALRDQAKKILRTEGGGGIKFTAHPTVVMVVGVNGVGKTTTIGKLATQLKAEGKTVVLAAGDTFRAAAVQQLNVWGKRVGCEVVHGKDGANPGAVIFDAIQRAKEISADVVLADTAGRLHTKTNLMEELKKVTRTMSKALDGAPHETLLVLDATNGQNAMQQAALFKEALPLSGIVLTKLDGTAKGGVILGICAEHELPVRYVGIGERAEDLRQFDSDEFVEAMLGLPGTEDAAA